MAQLVELRGGLIVDMDVACWLIDRELEGFRFVVRDGRIYVEPRDRLTPEQADYLTAHRFQALGILGYVPPSGGVA